MGAPLTVLDAQAVVAALTGEPAAAEVEALLRDPASPARITSINLGEVLDVLVRAYGRSADDVLEKLRWLVVCGLSIVDVDDSAGLMAGALRARLYDRVRAPVSLAECVALAAALRADDRLATSDPALLHAAAAEGCAVIPLPDSAGRRAGVSP